MLDLPEKIQEEKGETERIQSDRTKAKPNTTL